MPYPLKENNAYLTETDDGWAVIDLGIDVRETRLLWEEAVKKAGITFGSITKIVVTHCHPDHLGAAAWMQKMTGAPVFMSGPALGYLSSYLRLEGDKYSTHDRAIRAITARYDFGEEKTARVTKDWCDNVLPLFPPPERVEVLAENDEIVLDGGAYRAKVFAGHTDGQIVLWCKDDRTLISGDIFVEKGYLHFSDWPHSRAEQPLNELLSSLDAIEEMDPAIIYPGHGRPLSAYSPVFDRLRQRHARLLDVVEGLVSEPITPGRLYQKVFPIADTDYIQYQRMILGETIGYLDFLVTQGRIGVREEEGRVLYGK